MTQLATFASDWASPPGATIADLLATRRMSSTELARHVGETPERVAALLVGQLVLSSALAEALARALGGSSSYWLNRERQYREAVARLASQPKTVDGWLRTLPLNDMISRGWVARESVPDRQAAAALRYFGCLSIAEWHGEYARVVSATAYKTTAAFQSQAGALAAWLRQGELEAATIECDAWNAELLRAALPTLRALTQVHKPESFLPRLRAECARCGVAVVVVRAPTGCRASGATRFLTPTKALLLLSFRYLSDDQFWFAFFHEVGHLLLHDLDSIFVEDDSSANESGLDETDPEWEANQFAARTLVPEAAVPAMLELSANVREIVRFANKIGIAPGIVVGQLQHRRRLGYTQMQHVKRRYEWK